MLPASLIIPRLPICSLTICLSFTFPSLVLFLVFFRYGGDDVSNEDLADDQPKWQTAVMVGTACLVHGLLVIIITGIVAIALPSKLSLWANLLGIMAAGLAAVQYIPQIWTTYHLRHVGSLSIPMMCMQTPGGFVFAASLFGRLGLEGWSTWGIYILTALMQGTLLVMAVYFEYKAAPGAESSATTSRPAFRPRRPNPIRAYSEGLEDGLPGPYTAHPERYADTPEEFERLEAREERAVLRESSPLLRPGGIGTPRRTYNTNSRH
jgi:uncharacterized protein with PQ loop repeat